MEVLGQKKKKPLNLVLIGGIYGEFLSPSSIGNYMRPIQRSLRINLNIKNVVYIQPYFWQSQEVIRKKIANEIKRLKLLNNLDSFVVAHSKGAYDFLDCMVENPGLFKSEAIAGCLLLSPPANGSEIADKISRSIPWLNKIIGTSCLTTEKSINAIIDKSEDLQFKNIFQKKVVSVSHCAESIKEVVFILKPIYFLLKKMGYKSDGMLTLESQKFSIPILKHYIEKNHHGYLTTENLLSPISEQERLDAFSKFVLPFKWGERTADRESIREKNNFNKKLKMGTYNLGLLPIPILGVPHSKERLGVIPRLLKEYDFDILSLQEAFGDRIKDKLKKSFPDYYVFSSPRKPYSGLVTLVRKSLVGKSGEVKATYRPFKTQRVTETLTRFEKGFLTVDFLCEQTGVDISVVNLHLTAFRSAKSIRKKQIEELIEYTENSKVHFLCGDFNESIKVEPTKVTFRSNTKINSIKNILLREKSQSLDFIVPHCKDQEVEIEVNAENIWEGRPVVKVNSKYFVEPSDHDLVLTDINIFKKRVIQESLRGTLYV